MTLTEFLLARIAEDEAVAREASGSTVVGEPYNWRPSPNGDEWGVPHRSGPETEVLVALRPAVPQPPEVMSGQWGQVAVWEDEDGDWLPTARHIARHDPARVLAECAAKRRIVEQCEEMCERDRMDAGTGYWEVAADASLAAVRALASVYADHPDYRQEWALT